MSDKKEVSLSDMVADFRSSNELDSLLFYDELENAIQKILDKYQDNHRGICEEWLFGKLYGEKVPEQYLANKYHLSQPQVSRIILKFKKHLHTLLETSK